MFWLLLLLKIIGYIFCSILLLLIVLLVSLMILPFTYEGEGVLQQGFRGSFRLGWPWRLLSIAGQIHDDGMDMNVMLANRRIMKLHNSAVERPDNEEEATTKPDIEKPKKEGRKYEIKEFLNKGFINEMLEYLKRMLRIIKPKYLNLSGVYGFEDPSVTGMVCGAVAAVKGAVPLPGVELYPVFTDEVLEIDLKAAGRVQIGALVIQSLRTLLKKPVRRIIFKRRKKQEKK